MPYNTTAIPPRKEPTGQTQLPLSRVKKIISQDPDISLCSNNAAFMIACATEMFIQNLASEAHAQAKKDRKPRRNIQYKDIAGAVSLQDNLEFLEDVIPKTVPYKKIKQAARETQARLRADKLTTEMPANSTRGVAVPPDPAAMAATPVVNGVAAADTTAIVNGDSASFRIPRRADDRIDDPSRQLEREMRRSEDATSVGDGDVEMAD